MGKRALVILLLFALGALIPIIGFRSGEPADPGRVAQASAEPGPELDDGPAAAIVRRSIEFAGGWKVWRNARSVEYRKTTTPLGVDGNPSGPPRVERHRYVLQPDLKLRVDWDEDDGHHTLIHGGSQAWHLIDDEVSTRQEDVDRAYDSTTGSHYLFGMPFKLADPGATLTHEGRVELPDGTMADAVRVAYGTDVGSAGGEHHWTYYFDPDDARLRAYHIVYGPAEGDATFGEYADFQQIDGWRMPTRRTSYESSRGADRVRPSSLIVYEDVRLDVELGPELFRPPEEP